MTTLLPLYSSKVQAGFPSPADDYMEDKLDLNKHLIQHPAATFLVKVAGDAMQDIDMCEGDILIVDKSIKPYSGRVVIAVLDGQMLVRRLQYQGNEVYLLAANKKYPVTVVTADNTLEIWGVVTYVIHKF